MAEDDRINSPGEDDDTPQINVPSHDPLPLSPEVHYTRPNSVSSTSSTPRNEYGAPVQPTKPGATSMKYASGLAGGVTLASSIMAGYWLGNQIDTRWLHAQTPWGTIVMILAGTFTGFYNMFRNLKRAERIDRDKQ